MRCAWFVVLAACSPEIATGDYLCGAEESCPEGQVCDLASYTCVIPSLAMPFVCDPDADEDAAHATSLGFIDCVSQPIDRDECLGNTDKDDWFAFTTNPGCSSEVLSVSVAAPVAFEAVTVELFDATGTTMVATAADTCTSVESPDMNGETTRCISQTLVPGNSYTLRVTPTGDGDCGGKCAFNYYRLIVQTGLH
jgi:hypothetical protein